MVESETNSTQSSPESSGCTGRAFRNNAAADGSYLYTCLSRTQNEDRFKFLEQPYFQSVSLFGPRCIFCIRIVMYFCRLFVGILCVLLLVATGVA